MPNWCEGVLKIRGKKEDIKKFLTTALVPVDYLGNKMEIEIKEDDWSMSVFSESKMFHVKGTRRNFIDGSIEWCFDDKEVNVLVLNEYRGAWSIDTDGLTELSKEYNLDFKIYAFERGGQFNIDFEVHKGNVIKCEMIEFDDYKWECIDPTLGG